MRKPSNGNCRTFNEDVMKRIHSFMAAAFTMIAAASCVQELGNDGQLQEGAVVYKAVAEGADTKAVLGTNEAGRPQSMWENGDVIHIHIENSTSYRFSTSLSEPSAVADFVYQGTDEFQIQAGQAVIATYPDPDWADLYYRYALVWIPSTQQSNPEKESYDKKAVPVVAYSTDKTLHFKNAASLLKCQVNQASATRIRFYGLNDEVVAGRALAAMKENGEMDYVGIPEDEWNEHSVELSDASGGSLRSSWNYYISIIPNTFASGFGIELLNAEGEVVFTKQYDKSITIERNTILDLGTLGGSSDIEPSDDDYIDEYGINHGPGVEINGVVWAPVNCGYHAEDFKYGKLYQWGRKYGQGYDGDVTTPVVEDGGISLIAGIHQDNANKFYKGSAVANNDWLYSGFSVLWNLGSEYEPVKTEYDPCPEGWRVPTSAELESLSLNYSEWTTNEDGQNGYWFCGSNEYTSEVSQIFLPAAGWRNSGGGIAALRGTLADYWSSTFKYPKAERLAFDNSGVQMGEAARAYGFSVRCVQDESELIPVMDICLDITELSLEVNRFSRLRATVTPSDANHSWNVFWESDNTDVATVDQNGSIRAISAGTAVISAIAGMQSAECKVIVTEEADDNSVAEVTTIWEGSEYINWNGMTDLAYGAFDWSTVKPGTVLTARFTLDNAFGYWAFRFMDANWNTLPSFAEFADEYGNVFLSEGDTSYSITLTAADIDALVNLQGLVITGCNYTLTKVTLTQGSKISEETVLWEGNVILENFENQPTLLSDGGVELFNAGAQPGQTLYFYLETDASDWQFQLWEGHWCGLYLAIDSLQYNLSASGNRIGFTLTQDILDIAYTQQWWGGTFLVIGDNIKLTKITLI